VEERLEIVQADLLRGGDLPLAQDDVEGVARRIEVAREPLGNLAVLEMGDQLAGLLGAGGGRSQLGSPLSVLGAGVPAGAAEPSVTVKGIE
jgi:hypothetical protein